MYIERGKSKKINIRILEFWIEIWIVNNQQNYNLIHSVYIIFFKKSWAKIFTFFSISKISNFCFNHCLHQSDILMDCS